jgi:hypothetical protein
VRRDSNTQQHEISMHLQLKQPTQHNRHRASGATRPSSPGSRKNLGSPLVTHSSDTPWEASLVFGYSVVISICVKQAKHATFCVTKGTTPPKMRPSCGKKCESRAHHGSLRCKKLCLVTTRAKVRGDQKLKVERLVMMIRHGIKRPLVMASGQPKRQWRGTDGE